MWNFSQSLWQGKLWPGQVVGTFSEEMRNEQRSSSMEEKNVPF